MYIPAQVGGDFSSPDVETHSFGGPSAIQFAGEINSDIENGKLKPDGPKEQLYNLNTDPSETLNLIREYPENGRSHACSPKHDQTKGNNRLEPAR